MLAAVLLCALPSTPRAGLPRRALLIGASWAGLQLSVPTARADLPIAAYCIPGVTADRCRGVFWETGKLYRKEEQQGKIATAEEYHAAIEALGSMRKALADRKLDPTAEVGAAAANARIYLRKTGAFICRALDEEKRYDSEFQLNEAMAALDEVDREALVSKDSGVAPGFGRTALLLDRALASIDAFLAALPEAPTAVM
eukprot:scaffold245696_cov30-Tisochrysis_lutea.AAC.1